jgi:hypothetical protein
LKPFLHAELSHQNKDVTKIKLFQIMNLIHTRKIKIKISPMIIEKRKRVDATTKYNKKRIADRPASSSVHMIEPALQALQPGLRCP